MQFFKLKKLFFQSNYLVLLLIVLFYGLVAGPLIPEILIFIFLIYLIFNKKLIFPIIESQKNFFLIFLLFNIYLILNSFNSENYFLSFKNSLFFFRLIIPVLIISLIFEKFINTTKILTYSLLFLFFLLSFDSVYSLIYDRNLIGYEVKKDRISSFFDDELIMGSFIFRTAPFLMACIFLSNIKHKNQTILITIVLSFFLIILSGERTALISFLLFIILQVFLNYNFRLIFLKKLIIGFLFGTFILISFANIESINRLFAGTIAQIYDSNKNEFQFFSHRHENHFLTGISIFKQNILFGKGVNSFRVECKNEIHSEPIFKRVLKQNTYYAEEDIKIILEHGDFNFYNENNEVTKIVPKFYIYKFLIEEVEPNVPIYAKKNQPLWIHNFVFRDGCNTHPHNIIIQFLSELGLVGLIFLLAFYIYIFYFYFKFKKIKNKNFQNAGIIILCSILINYFPFFPSGNFFNNWLAIINLLPLGLFLVINKLSFK